MPTHGGKKAPVAEELPAAGALKSSFEKHAGRIVVYVIGGSDAKGGTNNTFKFEPRALPPRGDKATAKRVKRAMKAFLRKLKQGDASLVAEKFKAAWSDQKGKSHGTKTWKAVQVGVASGIDTHSQSASTSCLCACQKASRHA